MSVTKQRIDGNPYSDNAEHWSTSGDKLEMVGDKKTANRGARSRGHACPGAYGPDCVTDGRDDESNDR